MAALADAGFNVGLYGGYWDRFSETRLLSRGLASVDVLRKAIASCKVALCLVRRANRDGHVMRTFEVPAVGACMLTEDTPEHREIFGRDGQHVVYFKNLEDIVDRCRWLLTHPDDANRLRLSAHRLITNGSNTYGDRLDQMLEIITGKSIIENTVSSGHHRDTQLSLASSDNG
jgi:spore maturation protein CgeB